MDSVKNPYRRGLNLRHLNWLDETSSETSFE